MRVEKLGTPAQSGEKLGQIFITFLLFYMFMFVIDSNIKLIYPISKLLKN